MCSSGTIGGTHLVPLEDELLGDLGAEADPDPAEAQRVRAELDGLAALLESHFVYEEKQLVSVLNSRSAPSWYGSRPDFLLTTAHVVSGLGNQVDESTSP